ncbi:MAG: hypothetical protein MJZ76_07675 [Bacteroidales bacterium]|nr:hypothetical protein [Bacteroidales bacterium]
MKKFGLILLCAILLCMCKRPEKFSEVPYIEFVSIEKVDNGTGKDDQANLVVYFHDGDGDIGLSNADTTGVFSMDSTYYYNFFIDYYEKQNGNWILVELPTPLHARIPYLSENVPESIEGEITILTYINNYFSPYDTIKLRCQLVDRALHQSNIIETPEIIVNK